MPTQRWTVPRPVGARPPAPALPRRRPAAALPVAALVALRSVAPADGPRKARAESTRAWAASPPAVLLRVEAPPMAARLQAVAPEGAVLMRAGASPPVVRLRAERRQPVVRLRAEPREP